MSEEKSPIAEWYNDRSIFITVGSGFMGKVLLEKLLYTCKGVKNIYLLMRDKRGRSPLQRVEDMWKLPMFDRLKKSQPEAIKKVIPVIGELTSVNLGLKDSDIEMLTENVGLVFHLAATLNMSEPLKAALEKNVGGTANTIDLCKKMKQLKAFLYFSTAFCAPDQEVLEEKVYETPFDPRDILEVAKWMKKEALEAATPALIKPHPNSYTYTKRIAETLVAKEAVNIPVCIIRPSIVSAAGREPLPGWIDTLNGPVGLVAAAGKGVLRSMHCKATNRSQVVPVDIAIQAAIVIGQWRGSQTQHLKEVPVYNLTNDEALPMTWGEVTKRGRKIAHQYPFEKQIWYPDGEIRSSKYVHYFFTVLFQWLPALFIDTILYILRQKTFMIYVQKKLHKALELLQYFTAREWIFRSSKFLGLRKTLTEADKREFPMDWHAVPIDEYLKVSLLGARQYCLKEDLSTLPRCRIQQKFLYLLHKACVFGFYFGMLYVLFNWSPTVRAIFYTFVDYAKMLPVIETLAKTS